MIGREMKDTRVAGLTDGELSAEQAQALAQQLHQDGALQAELEQQREVKELMAGLPQYSAPDFMATRIMGEIATRRSAPARRAWRPAMTWGASAAAFVLSFGAAIGFWPQVVGRSATMMASTDQPQQMLPTGMLREVSYDPQPWGEVALPEGLTDPDLAGFIQFASAAHEYRKLQHATDGTSPDMPQVMLAMDGDSPNGAVVYAADSR
jgi:hypothetical protein